MNAKKNGNHKTELKNPEVVGDCLSRGFCLLLPLASAKLPLESLCNVLAPDASVNLPSTPTDMESSTLHFLDQALPRTTLMQMQRMGE